MEQKKRPVMSFRDKGISVAIWENQYGLSATIKKTYKVKDTNEYKESKSLNLQDLDLLIPFLNQAREYIALNNTQGGRSLSKDQVVYKKQPSLLDEEIPF